MKKLLKNISSLTSNCFLSWLLVSISIAWSFGQLGRIQLSGNLALYPHDALIVTFILVATAIITKTPILQKKLIKSLKTNKTLFLFILGIIGYSLIQAFLNQSLSQALYVSRLSTYLLFGYFTFFTIKNLKLFRQIIFSQVWIMIFLAYILYLFLPDTRFLAVLGWDNHFYRLIGPLFDPNFTGMIALIGLFLSLFWFKDKSKFFGLLFFSAALGLTFSRSSFAAELAGLVIYAFFTISKKGLEKKTALAAAVFAIFVCMVSIFLAPKPGGEGVDLTRTSTIVARTQTAQELISNIQKQPLTFLIGRGLFAQKNISSAPQYVTIPDHAGLPDNIILLIIDSFGVLGLIAILAVAIISVQKHLLKNNLSKQTWMLLTLFVALITHAQFNNSIFEPFLLIFWIMLWVTSKAKSLVTTKKN